MGILPNWMLRIIGVLLIPVGVACMAVPRLRFSNGLDTDWPELIILTSMGAGLVCIGSALAARRSRIQGGWLSAAGVCIGLGGLAIMLTLGMPRNDLSSVQTIIIGVGCLSLGVILSSTGRWARKAQD